MTKAANRYSHLVTFLGALGAAWSVYQYVLTWTGVELWNELQLMVCLVILCTICRSLPIYITRNYALDVSVLAIVAAVLVNGPYAAVVVSLVSMLFTMEYDDGTKTYHHLFNTSLIKSSFNNANYVLSILIPGVLILRLGFVPGVLQFPGVIAPMIVFTLLTFVINLATLLGLFLLDRRITMLDCKAAMRGLLPNVLAAMPLGLFTGILFTQEHGYWVAVIMLLPLMLARHAWKLYLDSQVQHLRLIQAFVSSMEAKDKYTEGHSRRVSDYAERIALMKGLRPQQVEIIKTAALLHDIGKIGISDAILQKPARLSEQEFSIIKTHPEIGVGIVERVGLQKEIIEIIRHHHERYDGTGYPDGLDHTGLSLGAEIMAVADSYDAMTTERPYRKGMPREVAFQQLNAGKGTQYNPELVDLLIAAISEAEPAPAPLPVGERQEAT